MRVNDSMFVENPFYQRQHEKRSETFAKNLRNSFPKIYSLLHCLFLIVLNLIVVIIQIGITLKRSAYYSIYAGFWAGGFNMLVGIISLLTLYRQNYLLLIVVAILNAISLVISAVGLVALSLYSITFYENCNTATVNPICTTYRSKNLFWTIFSIGVIDVIMSLVYATVIGVTLVRAFKKIPK